MNARFPSAVDGRFSLLSWLLPLVALVGFGLAPAGSHLALAVPLGVTLLVALLVAWVINATFYEMEPTALLARSGPFSWRIPYKDIAGIEESRSVRSGPAMSLDRLAVRCHDGRTLVVSPADKAGFIAALRRHAPQLEHPGNRV